MKVISVGLAICADIRPDIPGVGARPSSKQWKRDPERSAGTRFFV
jgi:hypothetical protein